MRFRLILLAAPALSLAIPASCGSGPERSAPAVAVVVSEVALDPGGNPVILLRERDGERALPIWVGIAEARSIATRLEEIEPPRPNTHDLATRLLDGLDARVERVIVTELRRRTYYGLVVMQGPAGSVEVDARPSDAIALALRARAPIFVLEPLFDAESVADPTLNPAREDDPHEGKPREPDEKEGHAI